MTDPTASEDAPEAPDAPTPPPSPPPVAGPPSRGGRAVRRATLAVLCLLLIALVVVVVVLPDMVADRVEDRRAPPPVESPAPAQPAPPPEDARRLAREKRDAEGKLGIALRMQTELEAEGVATWGGEDYDAALDTLAAGDAELQAGRFADAARHYEQVNESLQALRESMPARLTHALDAADAALAANDGPRAREQYAIALAIEPHNERAQQGMLRARVLEEVLAHIAAGRDHESRNALESARDAYAAALALDGRSDEARAAHDGVTERIRDRDFQAAMSVALSAVEDGDFTAARAALTRAEGVRPGTPEVKDARRRLQLAVQARRIESHRREAAALEKSERWREAGEHYASALAIDPTAAFARTGRKHSLERARIHAELDGYLGELGRLSAPGPRDNARRLLAAASDADPRVEPVLAAKVAKLERAIETAETPMQVRLQSDNLTEVTVYKVGRFGRLSSRDLLLPPGRYVAVGTRSGYRDVRVEFMVVAGEEPVDVVVRCQEKI